MIVETYFMTVATFIISYTVVGTNTITAKVFGLTNLLHLLLVALQVCLRFQYSHYPDYSGWHHRY